MGAVVRIWIESLISIFTKGLLHSALVDASNMNTDQPDQPKAKSQRPPGCRHAHPAPTSATAPRHPSEALAKYIDIINTIGKKLTDANSEPDVRYITTHPSTLRTVQQPALPTNKILNIPGRFILACFWMCLPSPRGNHHSLLLPPRVVTTELLNLGGTKVRDAEGFHLLFNPRSWRYKLSIIRYGDCLS